MAALPIPACGFSPGFDPDIDDGVERVVSIGGSQRGWSDYDAAKDVFTVVFDVATFAEAATARTFYNTNRLAQDITFTSPVDGLSYTCEYTGSKPFKVTPGDTFCKIVHVLRKV
jgi:hypothetical protein